MTGLWRSWYRVKRWTLGGRSASTPSSPLGTQSIPTLGPGTSTPSKSSKTISWRRTQLKSAETTQTLSSRVTKIATTNCQKGISQTKSLELSPCGSQMTWRVLAQMSHLIQQVFFGPCIAQFAKSRYGALYGKMGWKSVFRSFAPSLICWLDIINYKDGHFNVSFIIAIEKRWRNCYMENKAKKGSFAPSLHRWFADWKIFIR